MTQARSGRGITGRKRPWQTWELEFMYDNYKKMTWKQIAKKLDRSYSSVVNKKTYVGLGKRGGKRKQEYAAYKNDEIIAMGSAEEIASELGKRESYIRWCSTPSYQERVSKRKKPDNAFVVIKMGLEELE